jgi:hypothetical protein
MYMLRSLDRSLTVRDDYMLRSLDCSLIFFTAGMFI